MTKKEIKNNIEIAINYSEELKMLVNSLCEDIKDSSEDENDFDDFIKILNL